MKKGYFYWGIVGMGLFLSACHLNNKEIAPGKDMAFVSPSLSSEGEVVTLRPDKGVLPAELFLRQVEEQLARLSVESNVAAWAYSTDITPENEENLAQINARLSAFMSEYAQKAAQIDKSGLSAELKRKLDKLRLASILPSPADTALNDELSRLSAQLEGIYGAGKGEYKGQLLDLSALSNIVGDTKESPENRLEAWRAWHEVGKKMRDKYERLVTIANLGAKELGFKDTGDLWRSKYDLSAPEFSAELERLWGQVKPLYEDLHCYVRGRLNEKYGDSIVPARGPIPAHMLGNMWAQTFGNIYDDIRPTGNFPEAINVTERLRVKQYDYVKMVKTAENFYRSLGMRALPETFWTRSLFQKPEGREVVCHASAWDIDNKDDVRIKMCIEITDDDFRTIHHELGHNYYQMAYQAQPALFQDSANDGFHEAIGDTIALSVTPKYLKQIDLVDEAPDVSVANIPYLLQTALEKVAFLPFGLLVDQWRWKVFSGEVSPLQYNKVWWQLKRKYQGVMSVSERGEEFFDPAAKYHVAASVPYSRYFLADILQFQFYRSLCQAAGEKGPLYQCSFFQSKAAGDKLSHMLAMGASQPWQDALEVMTGSRTMDAKAIIDYFEPLQKWLKQENLSHRYQCGWE